MQEKETIIISLGGSMVVPQNPDYEFVVKFKELILSWVKKGKRFCIIVGGGKICRIYQDALSHIIHASNEELDWMGIYSTNFNAQFLRLSFGDDRPHDTFTNPNDVKNFPGDIIIGSGWKPGCSTDTDAVLVAEELKAKKIINISSVDSVYDSDPAKNPNAKKIDDISWHAYRSIISSEWDPGMNLPFDPVASKKAEELGLEVVFMGGHNLGNLDNYLKGEAFEGTTIK